MNGAALEQEPPTSPDRPTLGYESAAKPRPPGPRASGAAYHRAVGRVVILFIVVPVGVGSLLLGWALIDSGLGRGFFHGPSFFLLMGILILIFGLTTLGVATYHAVRLFR